MARYNHYNDNDDDDQHHNSTNNGANEYGVVVPTENVIASIINSLSVHRAKVNIAWVITIEIALRAVIKPSFTRISAAVSPIPIASGVIVPVGQRD